MTTMDSITFEQLEKGGLKVCSVLTLITVSELDRGKLTTLINLHDTGFNTSFESTSSVLIQIQSL